MSYAEDLLDGSDGINRMKVNMARICEIVTSAYVRVASDQQKKVPGWRPKSLGPVGGKSYSHENYGEFTWCFSDQGYLRIECNFHDRAGGANLFSYLLNGQKGQVITEPSPYWVSDVYGSFLVFIRQFVEDIPELFRELNVFINACNRIK